MSQLRLHLLGPPRLEIDGVPVAIDRRKAVALLVYLAVTAPSEGHARDTLATLFWPEYDQRRARATLRNTLWALNKTLAGDWLKINQDNIGLNPDADVWIDVAHFQDLLAACERHGHPLDEICSICLDALTEAVTLYRDDFLTGFTLADSPDFDDWQRFQADSLRQALADALERLVKGQAGQGRFKAAISHARRWLALDPLHEAAHRQLMRLYAQTGQQAAARRQYDECVRILDEELGLLPQAETQALYERIRIGSIPHPPSLLPPRPAAPPHNLPPQPTPFIGREVELAALGALMADPQVRLVTITGPGGMGKTRLALAAAERQLSRAALNAPPPNEPRPFFPNGIYFVSLAPLSSADQIVPTVAEALNFIFYGGGEPQQQLLDYLREKQLLLILDNFEPLLTPVSGSDKRASSPDGKLEGGAGLVADILQTAPGVQIVVTSRERLELQQEQLYPIQGFEYLDWETLGDAAEYAAVRLFLQSARRIRPDFELGTEDLTFLTHICRLVEGMPLGIELAASWVDILSLADIATEIQHSFDFLETEMRNVPARHRSMRAVFDTSWQRLNESERVVFAQLSVFRGGFTRTAAQQVAVTPDGAPASLRILATLASKSLLQYNKARDRYQVHELLRQYGSEQLSRMEKLAEKPIQERAVRDRHSAYYCAFLQDRESGLKGARQQAVLAEIELESENVLVAWYWAVTQGQIERLAQALEGLGRFYQWRGRYLVGQVAYQRAAQKLEEVIIGDEQKGLATKILARVLTWQSIFDEQLGHTTIADQLLQKSLELLDDPNLAGQDTRLEKAFALRQMSWKAVHFAQKAERLLKQSLTLYQAIGDRWAVAESLALLGYFTYRLGDYDEARRMCQEALEFLQDLGDQRETARVLLWLSVVVQRQGQVEEAERLERDSLTLMKKIGDRYGIADVTRWLGLSVMWNGRFAQAQALVEESLAIFDDLGHRYMQAVALSTLGYVVIHLGQYEQVRAHAKMSLPALREIGFTANGMVLMQLADLALTDEKYSEARALLRDSVATFREARLQIFLGLPLAKLGYVERALGNLLQARQSLAESLQIANQVGDVWILWEALPATALLLADQGQPERAVELYALAARYPYIANSRWFEDVAGRHISAVAAALPPEVVAGAQERGRARDLWATVKELLVELEDEQRAKTLFSPI